MCSTEEAKLVQPEENPLLGVEGLVGTTPTTVLILWVIHHDIFWVVTTAVFRTSGDCIGERNGFRLLFHFEVNPWYLI